MKDSDSAPKRILSVDAFRGFVMLLMMAEVMQLFNITKHISPGDEWKWFWDLVRDHTTHVEWGGCSLHDLIQPAFTFLVGVSLPFSIAQREDKEQSFTRMLFHAVWRSILLIALGIFLRSIGRSQTNWMFTDTLGQIGLGYTILFLIAYVSHRSASSLSWIMPWGSLILILGGYWALFAFYPRPAEDFDHKTVGVPDTWRASHAYDEKSFLAHWNKNTNPASEFDVWFLNQFPRDTEFLYPDGGYVTLSFIPTLGTMILGLIAGMWLRTGMSHSLKFLLFLAVGLCGIGLGEALETFEICPVVKRIWTPAWTIYSGGWTFVILSLFYLVLDLIGMWYLAFPLLVLGANSIVAYCTNNMFRGFLKNAWQTHLGKETFQYFGEAWEQPLLGGAVLLTLFLMLLWMYRNKVFVRI